MSSQQPISFDLLYSIRETQLQHGLRSDDFAKYHAYCTGRIKTLRKQLKLCNAHKIVSSNKKKSNNAQNNNNNKNQSNQKQQQQTKKEPKQGSYVAPTQVTENNCKDPRSIILLALVVERCWAESEELRLAKTGPADGKLMQRHQGNANLLMKHSRARLARAVQMTKRLVEVVDKVGDDALKNETHAYVSSIHGRFAFTSGDFASAKKHFLDARNRYHEIAVALSKKNAASSPSAGATENKTKSSGDNGTSTTVTATNQQKQALAVDLRGECDDRIVTCMRSLGEDASSYKPSMEGSTTASTSAVGGSGENSTACLSWLGREIPISNFQVQNALRRFDSLDVFKSASNLLDCAAAVEETNGTDGMAWWIYQQQSAFNKMQDSFDRAVGALNDAQDAVTAELTNHTTNAKASDEAMIDQLRLTQHCLKFRTLMCVVARAYLASWSLGSRFLLSTELLVQNGSNNKGNKPSSRLPAKRLINLPAKVSTAANFSNKEVAFTLQHVVSPIDVVRLFDTVLSSVEESLLLPGVDGEDVVEVLKEVVRSDRLFFVAAGWQVVGAAENEEALSRCVSALTHVEKVLNGLEKKHPDNGKANKEWIENFGFTCPVLAGFPRSLLVRRAAAARTGSAAMASIPQEASSNSNKLSPSVIEGGAVAKAQQQRKKRSEEKANAASSSSAATSAAPSSSLRHIASDKLQEFTTCSAFTEFPPDFQAAPCKPAFVDIASTYAEDYLLGMDDDDETSNNNTKPKQSSATKTSSKNSTNTNNNNNDDNNQQQQQQQAGSGGWLGWLRGS